MVATSDVGLRGFHPFRYRLQSEISSVRSQKSYAVGHYCGNPVVMEKETISANEFVTN